MGRVLSKLILLNANIRLLTKCEAALLSFRYTSLWNYFIILAKLHIWSSRHFVKSSNFDVLKEMVDIKYRTEKYIASKNNTEKKISGKMAGIYK